MKYRQKCLCRVCFRLSPVGGAGAQLVPRSGDAHVQYLFHYSQQMRLSQTVQTIWTDSEFHYDSMSHDKRKDLICPFINVTACILPTTQTHTNHLGDSIREEMMLITLFFRGSSAPLNVRWHTCYFILFTLMLCSTFRWRWPFRGSHTPTDPHKCDCWSEVPLFPVAYRTESHDWGLTHESVFKQWYRKQVFAMWSWWSNVVLSREWSYPPSMCGVKEAFLFWSRAGCKCVLKHVSYTLQNLELTFLLINVQVNPREHNVAGLFSLVTSESVHDS